MKAIIMAGGKGTRLRPLTCNIPKPMVPIMNKPVMEHIINLLKKHDITDIGVTLQYMPEVIKDYFGDGRDFGVNLTYFTEDTPLGTAGSVKNAQDFLDDTFLVISGDALTDIDLTKAINFHKNNNSLSTLVLTRVEVPLEYGVVVTENSGKIKGFLEKPSWSEVFSDTVNTGIYVLEPQCLEYFNHGQEFDFSKDLFPLLLEKGLPLFGHITEDYWCDVGDLKDYRQVHYDILDDKVQVNIPGYQLQGKVWVDEGVEIYDNCTINGPVVIGANCKIKDGAVIEPYCILGNGNIVDKNVSIKRSILWDGCDIGNEVQLRGTVLCNKVAFNANSSAFEGSVVGDGTVVKAQSSIKSNVAVWPDKFIDYGTQVTSNLIWGSKSTKNIFGKRGVTGKANTEITPEFVSKLASSYASTFKQTSKLGISYDGNPTSYMLKSCFVAGMQSLGVEVFDLGELILPIARDAVKFYSLDGGVHLGTLADNNANVNLTFLDKNGVNISKNIERKIENNFVREGFSRQDKDSIKEVKKVDNYKDFYLRNLINNVNSYNISTMNYKLLIGVNPELTKSILGSLMQELNCKYSLTNVSFKGVEDENLNDSSKLVPFLNQLNKEKCDIGVLISDNSEEMILVDDLGRVLSEDMFTAIVSLIAFNSNSNEPVVVPHSTSSVVDKLAREYEGSVLRTKTSIQDLMNNMVNTNTSNTSSIDQFSLNFDSISSLVKILDFMALNNLKLSEIVNMIPQFNMSKKVVECPWNAKGKVMRQLIEDKSNSKIELLEGVKLYKDGGWVLILPDGEQPMCRVISEGYTQEFAESLTDMYANKITNISTQEQDNNKV